MRRERRSVVLVGLCVLALAATLTLLGRVLLTSRYLSSDGEAEWVTPSDSLGMVLIDINDASDASFFHVDAPGVYVLAVRDKTSADAAGILTGDRIVALNESGVESSAQANELLDSLEQNATLTLTLARAGESDYLLLTLTVRGDEDG